MIVSDTDIPVNSETPFTPAQVQQMRADTAREALRTWFVAGTCVAPSWAVTTSGQVLPPAAMQQALITQSQQGATVDQSEIADAPEMVPFNSVPSDGGTERYRARFPKQTRRLIQPAVLPWGSYPAADTNGPCVNQQAMTVGEKLKANPWGTAFLVVGIGLIVYGSYSGR